MLELLWKSSTSVRRSWKILILNFYIENETRTTSPNRSLIFPICLQCSLLSRKVSQMMEILACGFLIRNQPILTQTNETNRKVMDKFLGDVLDKYIESQEDQKNARIANFIIISVLLNKFKRWQHCGRIWWLSRTPMTRRRRSSSRRAGERIVSA